jgi:hypothetical protein
MADPVRAQVPRPLSAAAFQDRQEAFVQASRPLREQMGRLYALWTRYTFADDATLVCLWVSPEAEACYHALRQLLSRMQQEYFATSASLSGGPYA